MQPMFYLYEVVQQIILYSIIEIHVVWYMFQYMVEDFLNHVAHCYWIVDR